MNPDQRNFNKSICGDTLIYADVINIYFIWMLLNEFKQLQYQKQHLQKVNN